MIAYFDHNATTPLDPRVLSAMQPWLADLHGNPSSTHRFGRPARQAVDGARQQVAELLGGRAEDIVFTASGSEANTMVIRGLAQKARYRGRLAFSALEHPSVRRSAEEAAALGIELDEISPEQSGTISVEGFSDALRDDTRLACLMLANNELGTIQPVAGVAASCRERGVPILCDAVQAVSKIPLSAHELGVDYLVIGGHKFHGPLGSAALWVRPGTSLTPMILGAPQEGGRRAGTENVPAIVGLGRAAELAREELAQRHAALLALRERFEQGLQQIPDTIIHCQGATRLPHTTHVAFLGLSGHELMLRLDEAGFAVSTGAACHSGRPSPSHALISMGTPPDEALASLRVSFGMTNSAQEVDALLDALAKLTATLRRAA